MTSPKPSASWQHMRRLLASKSKNELLNLIRDLYTLNTANKDFVPAQVLTPKPKAPKARQPKKSASSTSKVIPKIRQLATMAAELHEGASFNITRLTTLKSLCEDATAAAVPAEAGLSGHRCFVARRAGGLSLGPSDGPYP
jgi:hypothetical protein